MTKETPPDSSYDAIFEDCVFDGNGECGLSAEEGVRLKLVRTQFVGNRRRGVEILSRTRQAQKQPGFASGVATSVIAAAIAKASGLT